MNIRKKNIKKTNYILTGIVSFLLLLEIIDFEEFPTMRYRNSDVNQTLVIAYLNIASLSLGITVDIGEKKD